MDYEFSSKEELFNRVKPALHVKIKELNKLGCFSVKENDIWDYLIETKWSKSYNLMLSDIVDDILKLKNEEFILYLGSKR